MQTTVTNSTTQEQSSTVPSTTLMTTIEESTINSSKHFDMIKKQLQIFFLAGCYSPTVTLIPGQSTLVSPTSYRRSQDFDISSIIEFNCNGSLSMITRWTIKNCTTICLFQIELNTKVITTLSELYVPSRSLDYGTYEITLTVTMVDSPTLKTSSSIYVRITATGITANLVQLGTSMITCGNDQDLLLDPGTFSVDPDEDSFDASVSLSIVLTH
jgi:hypothetical protein